MKLDKQEMNNFAKTDIIIAINGEIYNWDRCIINTRNEQKSFATLQNDLH